MEKQTEWSEEAYSRFGQSLCEQIRQLLGDGYETELSQVKKNNGVQKDVLYIRQENNDCVPCFYMDEMFRSFCFGEHIEAIAEYVKNIVLGESAEVKEQVETYIRKEWIVENMFLRLVHYEKNKADLEQAVYVRVLDLAAVFYVLTEDSEEGVKSFRLPKSTWKSLELGEPEAYFHTVAMNTRKLFEERLELLEYMVLECMARRQQIELPLRELIRSPGQKLRENHLYVLTNHRRINGAAVILYPRMLEELAERFGGGFYVIPSSVHEVLLVKEDEIGEKRLNEMVKEVNETQLEPEDVLADQVYFYSPEKRRLFLCE